ncbi:large ribosomal subunit protein uL4m-like isoform X2 [Gordionus sp. m RMFG-2023]|uniref:large ribosomal subunit protein uL4m-like isoform X2 n=1 Tax=Gordionus sp. m RMFG-2023 TaxID=3053472 RepID=UPI0031FBBC69
MILKRNLFSVLKHNSKGLCLNTEISDISQLKEYGHVLRELKFPNLYTKPRQAWIQTLKSIEDQKLGIIDLHPDIFATIPRLDLIKINTNWQENYRNISFKNALAIHEVPGSFKKPWPQKGTGRARAGNRKGNIWHKGGTAHGPRAPKSYFRMEDFGKRLKGLCSTLTVKFAQDDIHIVDDLEIPTDDPDFLQKVIDERDWGLSVLFVDNTDYMPKNIAYACHNIPQFNLLPVYGLNILMMLKYEGIVFTRSALEELENKLLFHMHKEGLSNVKYEPRDISGKKD